MQKEGPVRTPERVASTGPGEGLRATSPAHPHHSPLSPGPGGRSCPSVPSVKAPHRRAGSTSRWPGLTTPGSDALLRVCSTEPLGPGAARAKGSANHQAAEERSRQHVWGRRKISARAFTGLLEALIQAGPCLSTPSWPGTWRKGHQQSAWVSDGTRSCEEVSSVVLWGPSLI